MTSESAITARHTPVIQSASDAITDKQAKAYSALLTQVATIVTQLRERLSASYYLNTSLSAIQSWRYLLMDIETQVLPEFYVVFQDTTTTDRQRRQLYDMTQAIYYALNQYNTTIFVQKLALCLTKTQPLATHLLPSHSPKHTTEKPQSKTVDIYQVGAGKNAELAYILTELATHVAIDSDHYIAAFKPYHALLLSEKALLSFFTEHNLTVFKQTLSQWQAQRLSAFAVLDDKVIEQYKHLNNSNTINTDPITSSALARKLLRQSQIPIPVSQQTGSRLLANTSSFDLRQFTTDLFVNDAVLKKGLKYSGISLGLYLIMALGGSWLIMILGLPYLVTLLMGSYALSEAINYEKYAKTLQEGSGIITIIAIPIIVTEVCIALLAYQYTNSTDAIEFAPMMSEMTDVIDNKQSTSSTLLETADVRQINTQVAPTKIASIKKTPHQNMIDEAIAFSDVIAPKTNYDLPLDIDRHAYHLSILLSDKPTECLKSLIVATNKLYDQLSYLQSAHPYLATRVDELIKDLTHNTIIRLDELAQQFVQNGKVDEDARQIFIEQHETRIDDLIRLNLTQVNELNKKILEKKMAGFAKIGNDKERQFRDSIMELKILLRWLIAQQPDEIQASSHEVILENLEASTLEDMQSAFFNSQTTAKQRQDLQSQLDTLINHFKQQTVTHIYEPNSEQDMKDLLILSKGSNKNAHKECDKKPELPSSRYAPSQQIEAQQDATKNTQDADAIIAQATIQEFIEFNHHYINEIATHWH